MIQQHLIQITGGTEYDWGSNPHPIVHSVAPSGPAHGFREEIEGLSAYGATRN